MSALATIAELFERAMNDGAPCAMEPCDTCPVYADGTYDDVSCQSTIAKLLKAARSEPWESRIETACGGHWCGLCGAPVEPWARECPGCGAVLR